MGIYGKTVTKKKIIIGKKTQGCINSPETDISFRGVLRSHVDSQSTFHGDVITISLMSESDDG